VVRGQFKGYRSEEGVAPQSEVETFVALRAHVDTWRWAGVPFYIRVGKCLPTTSTEVLGSLRRPPEAVFAEAHSSPPNYLRFSLSPDITISLGAKVKAPGEALVGQDVELTFYEQPQSAELAPYERLLGDALAGDASLFAREDAVEAAWAVVDRVRDDATPLHLYELGTWGPDAAAALIARHGGWHDPGSSDPEGAGNIAAARARP
jgi:glucose-6-phosphate 1-dehydrogenase